MNGRIVALAGVTMVAVVALAVLGTWRWASAIGPDVNNDGQVRVDDVVAVVNAYRQYVPTPTPQPTATPQPTPTPVPIARELHIVFLTDSESPPRSLNAIRVPVDSSRYPAGRTAFQLDATVGAYQSAAGSYTTCVRLLDVTDGFPGVFVPGSAACVTPAATPGGSNDVTEVTSGPFTIPTGRRIYSLERTIDPNTPNAGPLRTARLIAQID